MPRFLLPAFAMVLFSVALFTGCSGNGAEDPDGGLDGGGGGTGIGGGAGGGSGDTGGGTGGGGGVVDPDGGVGGGTGGGGVVDPDGGTDAGPDACAECTNDCQAALDICKGVCDAIPPSGSCGSWCDTANGCTTACDQFVTACNLCWDDSCTGHCDALRSQCAEENACGGDVSCGGVCEVGDKQCAKGMCDGLAADCQAACPCP